MEPLLELEAGQCRACQFNRLSEEESVIENVDPKMGTPLNIMI